MVYCVSCKCYNLLKFSCFLEIFFIKHRFYLKKSAVSHNFGTFKTLHLQSGLQFIALLKWEHPPIIFTSMWPKPCSFFTSGEFCVCNNQNALLHLYECEFSNTRKVENMKEREIHNKVLFLIKSHTVVKMVYQIEDE